MNLNEVDRETLAAIFASRVSLAKRTEDEAAADARVEHQKTVKWTGDIEEGLNAASAIGDDMIQKQTQGRVVPDAFTHGSSQQRVRWFKRGFENAQMQACDTFSPNRSEL